MGTTPSMTSGQKRDIRKLLREALDEAFLSKASAQRVLGRGGALKDRVKELLGQLGASDLLEFVTTVTLSAIPSFDVEAHFTVTPDKERRSAEVVIGWVGDNVKRLAKGMVEPAVAEATLRVHTLAKASVDGPIIAELGGEEVVTTSWGQMYEMIKRQGRGQQGILPADGRANIFYIPDHNGVLWATSCVWYSDYAGWRVEAYSITHPLRWVGGYQVISR